MTRKLFPAYLVFSCACVLSSPALGTSVIDTLMVDHNLGPIPGPGGSLTLQFNDLVAYNTEMGLQIYSIPKPNLPSAHIHSGDPLVRAFSQAPGSNSGLAGFDPAYWEPVDNNNSGVGFERFNLDQSPDHWFGLTFNNQGELSDVLTVSQLIAKVGSTNFGYTFDQNQTNSTNTYSPDVLPSSWENGDPDADGQKAKVLVDGTVVTTDAYTPEIGGDIWLKGRLILVHPDKIGDLDGNAAIVQSTVAGLVEGTEKMTFRFDDTLFGDYPDDAEFYSAPLSPPSSPELNRSWVHLPGISYYDPTDLDTTIVGPGTGITTVDNNGDAAHGDWAGFLLDDTGNPLDYGGYANWGFLLEVQGIFDEAGKEEVYIFNLGEQSSSGVIPEPLTVLGLLAGLGGLAGYLRRRCMA